MKTIKTKFITSQQMPLVIEPADGNVSFEEMLQLLRERKEYFKSEVLKHGGILFRNFPINNEDAFAAVLKSLDVGEFVDYIGGDSPRNKKDAAINFFIILYL